MWFCKCDHVCIGPSETARPQGYRESNSASAAFFSRFAILFLSCRSSSCKDSFLLTGTAPIPDNCNAFCFSWRICDADLNGLKALIFGRCKPMAEFASPCAASWLLAVPLDQCFSCWYSFVRSFSCLKGERVCSSTGSPWCRSCPAVLSPWPDALNRVYANRGVRSTAYCYFTHAIMCVVKWRTRFLCWAIVIVAWVYEWPGFTTYLSAAASELENTAPSFVDKRPTFCSPAVGEENVMHTDNAKARMHAHVTYARPLQNEPSQSAFGKIFSKFSFRNSKFARTVDPFGHGC